MSTPGDRPDRAVGERTGVSLPSAPASIRRARHFLADTLQGWRVQSGVVDVATLLTSELVTNAVRHGRGLVVLTVQGRNPAVRVEVHDDSPDLPEVVADGDETAESGRGLQLVDALAARWGAEPHPRNGKDVWFELDV